jgi:hypothetical protein
LLSLGIEERIERRPIAICADLEAIADDGSNLLHVILCSGDLRRTVSMRAAAIACASLSVIRFRAAAE